MDENLEQPDPREQVQSYATSTALPAPDWLIQRMKTITQMPPPTLQEVETSFRASERGDYYSEIELRQGFLRYEALRKLTPRQFADLHKRNMAGERFDDMVDELIQPQKEPHQ